MPSTGLIWSVYKCFLLHIKGPFLVQELYPGNQEPFQELGIFPPREPGSKFHPGVVFRSQKSPCPCVVAYNGPATSCVGAATLQHFRIHFGQVTMIISLGSFMSYWETVYICRAFVWTQRWEDTTGGQTMPFKLCLACLFRLFYNNQQYASGMLTLALY